MKIVIIKINEENYTFSMETEVGVISNISVDFKSLREVLEFTSKYFPNLPVSIPNND